MPGRTTSDAFRAFAEPLERALACLGRVKLTVSHGGRSATDRDHSWTLNGGNGWAFPVGFWFDASMVYRFVRDGDEWRVSTVAYQYRLLRKGEELFVMHWHPTGSSPHTKPHLHLSVPGGPDGLKKQHLPVGRMTLEDAIEWVIAFGVPPARDDWKEVLHGSKKLHIEHRSWNVDPNEAIAE